MSISRIRSRLTALTFVAFGVASGLGETDAQAQLLRGLGQGGQYKVKIKERGYYRAPYIVSPYTTNTYIQSAPVTVTETQVYQPAPVVQQRVYQPAPYVESRVIQPPPVVETQVYRPAPIIQERTYSSFYPY